VLTPFIYHGILQKFSNYRVQLVVVGDFILESNKGKMVNFLPEISDALKAFYE
jgi:hypothetical protein